jgi:hypothetical protein
MNIKELIDNWQKLDKTSFTENIELEYDDDDPVYVRLKAMAEENNVEFSEFISALIYDWYLKDTESKK